MIQFSNEMHSFSLLCGFCVYLILLVLSLIIAYVIYRIKHTNLFRKRLFLCALFGGLFLFPCFSWLSWRVYSLHIIHSYAKMIDSCDSVKITIPTGMLGVIALSSGYHGDIKSILYDKKTEYRTELVITDRTVLKSLSNLINQSDYHVGTPVSSYITYWGTVFYVFKNDKQICTFTVLAEDNLLLGKYGCFFSLKNLQKEFYRILPEMQPLVHRAECAANIERLGFDLDNYTKFIKKGYSTLFKPIRPYPDPNYWNDLLLAYHIKAKDVVEQSIFKRFMCHNHDEALCDFAMNPICTPESPNDVVLLFEADSGWNQHGGSELMVFDHHEPPGCNVLLNDGTARFITPDQIDTLNWGIDENLPTIKEE